VRAFWIVAELARAHEGDTTMQSGQVMIQSLLNGHVLVSRRLFGGDRPSEKLTPND